MRSLPYLSTIALAILLGASAPAAAAQSGASLVVSAHFSSRTSLKVSTELLQFEITRADQPAVAAVHFSAGARTQAGAEVLLSVEAVRGVDGAGGAADVESALTFAGEGDGTLAGVVTATGPTVASRWVGSGLRNGRLLFSLRAAASGTYTVPVRFVLSAP